MMINKTDSQHNLQLMCIDDNYIYLLDSLLSLSSTAVALL